VLSLSVDYQSLVWSTNTSNYWSPIQLKASSSQYESPPGILPDSLSKHGEECSPGPVLLPCTIIAVNSSISPVTEATLSDILGTYQAIDDVWMDADFLECIFIQSTDGSSVDESSFADFSSQTRLRMHLFQLCSIPTA
jgi:hypothetical protein